MIFDFYSTGIFEEELLTELKEHSVRKEFNDGDIIIDVGDNVTDIPLVVKGSVKVMRPKEDAEFLLYYLESGDTCAISTNCCVSRRKSNIKAIADGPTIIDFIPGKLVGEWMGKYDSWRRFIIDNLRIRLDEAHDTIYALSYQNLEERLKNYLENRVKITKSTLLRISHADIANDLNSSRVVISRALKKLENQKEVELLRNQIKVLNY